MKRIKIGIFIFAAAFILGSARVTRPATPSPLVSMNSALLHTRETLMTFSDTALPFLSGTLPSQAIRQIFHLVARLPDGIELTGHQLQINKILASLFPAFASEHSTRGTMDFTLSLHHQRGETILLNSFLSFHALKMQHPFPAFIRHAEIRCWLLLNPRKRTVTGPVTCTITGCGLTLSSPRVTQVAIREITLRGTLQNRHYTFTGQALHITSRNILWGNHRLEQIQLQALSFTPKGLLLKSLCGAIDSQPFTLTALHCHFSPLKLGAVGTLSLKTLKLPIHLPLPLHKIKGNITFQITGDFQASAPALTGTVQANRLDLYVGKAHLDKVSLHIKGSFEKSHVVLPSVKLSLGSELSLQGTFHASPPKNLQGTLRIHAFRIKNISSLLGEIFPKMFSDLHATGELRLKSRVHLQPSIASMAGTLSLQGTLRNIVLPITLKQIRLKLPFNLRIPLHGGQIPQMKVEDQPLQEPSGSLAISRIKFGSLALRNLAARLTLRDHLFRISAVTCAFSQGNILGHAYMRLLPPFSWGTKIQLRQISLRTICNSTPGLEDALSGKVNAHLTLLGNGGKLRSMHGTLSARTFKTRGEPMHISQAFIRKLTGKKGRFLFHSHYRPYSRGRLEAVIHHGIITFKSLELSHSFLGFHDLSVTVAPASNRIGLKELIWEILQMPGTGAMAHPVIKTK